MLVRVGALVTVELAEDAPERDLPWIITFGPLDDEGAWDPVVCGPYERLHALALAQEVVADDELMAVVEPMQPKVSVADIRAEIKAAQELGLSEPSEFYDDPFDDLEADEDDDEDDEPHGLEHGHAAAPPSEDEVRGGFARIFQRLNNG